MRYQNGVPLVDVKVDVSGSNKEIIEAIQAQNAASNGGDPEMKALLKQLANLMIQKESEGASPKTAEATFEQIPEDMTE